MATNAQIDEAVQSDAEVYLPAFLEKCAERGYDNLSEEDLQGLIDIAATYRMHKESSRGSVIKEASQALKQVTGVDKLEAASAREQQTKAAADKFLQNPKIRESLAQRIKEAAASQKE